MLEQPDELARRAGEHRLDPRLHRRHRLGVGNEPVGDAPFGPQRGLGGRLVGIDASSSPHGNESDHDRDPPL